MIMRNDRITTAVALATLVIIGLAFDVGAKNGPTDLDGRKELSKQAVDPAAFLNPPISARPGAFWAWLEGRVNLDRITYELEEMKAKGMGGADIWDVHAYINPNQTIPAGPTFLGEASLKAIAHALREAKRLGLDMGMVAALLELNAFQGGVEDTDLQLAARIASKQEDQAALGIIMRYAQEVGNLELFMRKLQGASIQ